MTSSGAGARWWSRAACLAGPVQGIWGGTTKDERRLLGNRAIVVESRPRVPTG